jgi:hypothetical protein
MGLFGSNENLIIGARRRPTYTCQLAAPDRRLPGHWVPVGPVLGMVGGLIGRR